MADDIPGVDFNSATFEPADEGLPDDAPERTRTRKKRSDAGVPRGSRSGTTTRRPSASSNAKLIEELTDPIAKLAVALAFQSPTAAGVLVSRGEATAKALVTIAETRPRMLAALKRVSQVGPASELAQTGVMLFIAIQMDIGRIPPEHPLAIATGVASLYAQTHPVETLEDNTGIFGNFTPPPGFVDRPAGPTDPGHPLYSFTAGPGANSLLGQVPQ